MKELSIWTKFTDLLENNCFSPSLGKELVVLVIPMKKVCNHIFKDSDLSKHTTVVNLSLLSQSGFEFQLLLKSYVSVGK